MGLVPDLSATDIDSQRDLVDTDNVSLLLLMFGDKFHFLKKSLESKSEKFTFEIHL